MNKAFDDFLWEDYSSTKTPLAKRLLNKVNSALKTIDERVMRIFNDEIPNIKNTKLDTAEAYGLVSGISLDERTGILTITRYHEPPITIDTMLEKLAVNFDYYADTQKLVIILSDGTQKEVDLSALITQYEFLDSETIYFSVSTNEDIAFNAKWNGSDISYALVADPLWMKIYQSIILESELEISQISATYAKPNSDYYVNADICREISGDDKIFTIKFPGGAWKWNISMQTQEDIGDGTKKVIGYYTKPGCVTAGIKEGSIQEKHLRPDYLSDIRVESAKADSSADSAAQKALESANSALLSKSYNGGDTGIREGEDTDNAKYYSEQARQALESLEQAGVTGVKGDAETVYRKGNVSLTAENVGAEPSFSVLSISKGGTGQTTALASLNSLTDAAVASANGYALNDNDSFLWKYTSQNSSTVHKTKFSKLWEYIKGKLTKESVGLGNVDNTADVNKNVNSAKVLANARRIFGIPFNGSGDVSGQALVHGAYQSAPSQRYSSGGLQIRENGLVGNSQTDIGYAPAIGFHWLNKAAASLLFHLDGKFHFLKQNGVDVATIVANLEGNATTATSAASATKATQDGNGNNISETYLKKTGGTMTGSIITPENDNMGIIPATNNYGQIGSSEKKFYRMYASTFYGNATSATKATQDGNGNNIANTYQKKRWTRRGIATMRGGMFSYELENYENEILLVGVPPSGTEFKTNHIYEDVLIDSVVPSDGIYEYKIYYDSSDYILVKFNRGGFTFTNSTYAHDVYIYSK